MDIEASDHSPAGLPEDVMRLLAGLSTRLRTPLREQRRAEVLAALLAAHGSSATAPSASAPSATPLSASASDHASGVGPRRGPRRALGRALVGPSQGTRVGRRRMVLAAGVTALALIGTTSVVLLGGDDLPLVQIGGGAAAPMGDASAAAGSLRMAESGDAATSMMWTPTLFRFVLADGVDFPADSGPAWRLVPPTDLAAAAVPIAEVLGLPRPVTSEWDANALQSDGADGSSLWFNPSGDWYFSGVYDEALNWDCPEPILEDVGPGETGEPGEAAAIGECVPPPPLDGVPDADRARSLASRLLASLGHSDIRISSVHVDDWSAWVSAELTDAGVPAGSGLMVGVGFGGAERVTSAHGTLASVEPLGSYPTIDAAAALTRLEAEMSAWMDVGPMARPYPMPADERSSTGNDVTGDETDDVTDDETPVPVEVAVTIVSIELMSMVTWSSDGMVLLVPHYRLVDQDGGWWFVVAVADRYVAS